MTADDPTSVFLLAVRGYEPLTAMVADGVGRLGYNLRILRDGPKGPGYRHTPSSAFFRPGTRAVCISMFPYQDHAVRNNHPDLSAIHDHWASRGIMDVWINIRDDGSGDRWAPSDAVYFKREPPYGKGKPLAYAIAPWMVSSRREKRQRRYLIPYRNRDDRRKGMRYPRAKILSALADRGWCIEGFGRTGWHDPSYLAACAGSDVVVALPGQGWDTVRFWEAWANGAVPIVPSQTLDRLRIDPSPERDAHVATFDSFDDLEDRLRRPPGTGQIAVTWAQRHHRTVDRARQIMEQVTR